MTGRMFAGNTAGEIEARYYSHVVSPTDPSQARWMPLSAAGINALCFSATGTSLPALQLDLCLHCILTGDKRNICKVSQTHLPAGNYSTSYSTPWKYWCLFTKRCSITSLTSTKLLDFLFLISASGNDWQCFTYTVQKPTPGNFTQWSRAVVWAEHPGLNPSSATDSLQKFGEIMYPSEQNGGNNHSYLGDGH